MLSTSEVILQLKTLQAAFSVISFYNLTAPCYPPDAQVSDCANRSYDYVVVGGDLAGSVVSARLVEAGYSVLVIEAGGLPSFESTLPSFVTSLKNSRLDYNYTAEADDKIGCHKSNSLFVPKVLGGKGTTNFMIYERGNPSNYENWSKDGTWKWQNMMKYFKKSERLHDPNILNSPYRQYHGINGKISITRETDNVCDEYIKGFERAGQPVPLDNVGNASLGYSRGLYYIYKGMRTSSATSYITPLKNNPKIHISLYSLATRIIFDDKKNAVGVEFIKDGTKLTVKAKKEVIISAGPIKSPQLLMLSGIGPKKQLKQWNITSVSDLPVGQNFQNVIGALLVFKTNKKANTESFNAYKFPSSLIVGYAATDKSRKYPDYGTLNYIVDNYFYFLSFCGVVLDFENKICDQLYRQAQNTQLMVTTIGNFFVKSRGQILLKSANPEDQPKIITGYYSNGKDLDAIVKIIQHFIKVVSTPYFKDVGLEFLDPTSKCSQLKKGSREYWRCYALCMMFSSYGYVGTNSIGAVVDSKLCVYGINKLRVVDASVIPNTISGVTNAPIVALAEKAAEMIISEAKSV